MSLKMNTFFKMPGKFLLEILMNEQPVQRIVLNGDNGKMTGMQGNKTVTGAELEKMKLQAELFPENKYEKLGYKTELMGVEKIDGKDAYLIQITSPAQSITKEYYAVESGLKIRTISTEETPMGPTTQTSDIVEYSTVKGIQFPKKEKYWLVANL
jgi:zinc protease